ncbi:MAG: N-acetylmuramoyl-L-alanine amidase [Armatimonadota bacterium]
MSILLLFGMMVASLMPSRVQAAPEPAKSATSKPEKVVIAQARPAARPSGSLKIVSTPNKHYSRTSSRRIDTIVMHYISGINVDRSRWDDPALSRSILNRYGFSAHYLVARDGTVYKLVDEKNVAWHAGGSIMPAPDNRKNANRFSVGIEIIATHKSGYTEAQYDALEKLVSGIKSRHSIRHIVGHDEIAGRRAVGMGLRKDLKQDPGPLFDWSRFR